MIKFEVPGQPQGKGRPKASRRGNHIHMRTPEKTVMYENWVKQCAIAELKENHIPYEVALTAIIDMYFQIPKSGSKKLYQQRKEGDLRPTTKPDIDNSIKAILDSLNGIVYKDDSQVVTIIANKYYSEVPRVEVQIIEKLER